MNEKIHIALAFYDKNGEHSKFAGTTIVSVFENTAKCNWQNIVIHILHDETLTIENKKKFIQLVNDYKAKINFYNINIDEWGIDRCSLEKSLHRISIGALYRLALPKVLINIDKVIYLDTDIVVQIDILDLNNIAFDEKLIIAVSDIREMRELYVRTEYYKKAGLNYKKYFNSGMLVLNLVEVKKYNLLGESIKLLKKYNKFADQDVLNIIFKDKIKFIDKRFNTLIDIQKINTSKNKELQDGMAVLHFAGYLKPWNCANKEIIKIYYSYMAKTPWIKNNDDLITVMSDISVQYDKKMDLKNCLYCKPKCGMSDNFLLFMKAVLSKDSCFKFLNIIRKIKFKFSY